MNRIAIALIEPLYEMNVGYLARIMANFGFGELYLIEPKVELYKARKFASHGYKVLEDAKICGFRNLTKEFDYLVGTTAIVGKKPTSIFRAAITPEKFAQNLGGFSGSICLIFGRDTTGLKKEELELCDLITHIPVNTSYPTLNISHAAAIILYEISKKKGVKKFKNATRKERERLIEYFIELAQRSNIPKHKITLLKEAIKQVFGRARLRSREATLLMGFCRKLISKI